MQLRQEYNATSPLTDEFYVSNFSIYHVKLEILDPADYWYSICVEVKISLISTLSSSFVWEEKVE